MANCFQISDQGLVRPVFQIAKRLIFKQAPRFQVIAMELLQACRNIRNVVENGKMFEMFPFSFIVLVNRFLG